MYKKKVKKRVKRYLVTVERHGKIDQEVIYIFTYISGVRVCECAHVCIYPFACQCVCKYTPFHLLYVHSIIELPINSLNCTGKSLWPPLWF